MKLIRYTLLILIISLLYIPVGQTFLSVDKTAKLEFIKIVHKSDGFESYYHNAAKDFF